jgi:hypothetical protein
MRDTIPLPPGERAPAADVHTQASLLAAVPALQRVLDAIPAMTMLLNLERQVVFAGRRLVEFAGVLTPDDLLGLRFGEVLGCVNAPESGNGCGTTSSCTVCGALRSLADVRLGCAQTHFCSLVRRNSAANETLDLEIAATPIEISGQPFVLVCAANAADRVRRDRLEHGILPQVLALSLEMEALARSATNEAAGQEIRRRALDLLAAASRRLSQLVRSPDDLADADPGRLSVSRSSVSARDLLTQAIEETALRRIPGSPAVLLDVPGGDAMIETDPGLARRVLGEILLNAREATQGEVTAGFRSLEDHVKFFVSNPGEMPRAVQLQVFSRGFSSKAPGRGYGVYFARLVTERYLEGSVSFRSSVEGVTFTVSLPRAGGTQEVATQ